jgi:hypothetical protein
MKQGQRIWILHQSTLLPAVVSWAQNKQVGAYTPDLIVVPQHNAFEEEWEARLIAERALKATICLLERTLAESKEKLASLRSLPPLSE